MWLFGSCNDQITETCHILTLYTVEQHYSGLWSHCSGQNVLIKKQNQQNSQQLSSTSSDRLSFTLHKTLNIQIQIGDLK